MFCWSPVFVVDCEDVTRTSETGMSRHDKLYTVQWNTKYKISLGDNRNIGTQLFYDSNIFLAVVGLGIKYNVLVLRYPH